MQEEHFLTSLAQRISSGTKTSLLEWVQKYRLTDKGKRFEFSTRPYLKQVYEDESPHIVIKKAAQTGGTEFCISRALYFCDDAARPVTVIYTMPTDSDIGYFT